MDKSASPTPFHRQPSPTHFPPGFRSLILPRDLGRLMGWLLNERTTRKLDADQHLVVTLVDGQGEEEALVMSESAVYALMKG